MARKIEKVDSSVLESIVTDGLQRIGIQIDEDRAKLLFRLIISGIGKHFFINPDTSVQVGFMEFTKSPDLDELFAIKILRNDEIYNAEALYKYYRGEFHSEKKIKEMVESFVDGLLDYSQQQNLKINELTNTLNKSTQTKAKRRK